MVAGFRGGVGEGSLLLLFMYLALLTRTIGIDMGGTMSFIGPLINSSSGPRLSAKGACPTVTVP